MPKIIFQPLMISNPAGRLAGLRFKFYVTPIKKRCAGISGTPSLFCDFISFS